MPSFASLFAAAAVAVSTVLAQDPNFDSINTPVKNAEVPAGQPFTITWSLLTPTTPTGPATITLIGGPATDQLSPVAVIGHVQNEDLKFVWNVDPTLGALAFYGLNLTLDADTSHFQYSSSFTIVGGSASGTPSGSGSGTPSGTASGTESASSTSAPGTTSGTTSAPTTVITTTSSAEPTTIVPTTTAAPTHASNSTSNSTSSTASKTSPATKPTTTSGANSLSGLSAIGAVALALVASAAMNWGL